MNCIGTDAEKAPQSQSPSPGREPRAADTITRALLADALRGLRIACRGLRTNRAVLGATFAIETAAQRVDAEARRDRGARP